MAKITYDEYLKMLRDLDVPEKTIMAYSRPKKGAGGAFDIQIEPDPKKVEMTPADLEAESAMQIGNAFCRWRRQMRFKRRLANGEKLPVLVSEGDSWFQFPLFIDEVVDQLGGKYLIWSVDAAGDTAENMVFGKPEYMKALREQKPRVKAFLFSAAGNDIIGEDPETQVPVLLELLKDFNGNANDVAGHVNMGLFSERLDFLRKAYTKVVTDIRAEPGFGKLPVIIHGYDYAFPYPEGKNDKRDPEWAKKDEWLGIPFRKRKIKNPALRRNIVKFMIDALYDMLGEVAGDSAKTRVWLVNCRGAMPNLTDWADEIHGTSKGFAKVAKEFGKVLTKALG